MHSSKSWYQPLTGEVSKRINLGILDYYQMVCIICWLKGSKSTKRNYEIFFFFLISKRYALKKAKRRTAYRKYTKQHSNLFVINIFSLN